MLVKDNDAQLQVLEVILVAGMLLISVYFIRGIDIVSQSNVEKENKLESMGDSLLESLAAQPDSNGRYNSLLAYYCRVGTSSFANYVEQVLPEGTIFKIERIDLTRLVTNQETTIKDATFEIYSPDIWFDDDAKSSRICVVDGTVYRIVLSMWFNSGG